jgi:crossover junction endodeoxyribonuclease RusA
MIWELEYRARPWLLNEERAGGKRGVGGHRGRATLTREWRDAFAELALLHKVPPLETLEVEVFPICRDRRRSDVGNVYPAAKAAIDGLVDGGIVPDDSDDYVQALMFRPSLILGYSALRVIVTGTPCCREEADSRERAYRQRLIRQFVT